VAKKKKKSKPLVTLRDVKRFLQRATNLQSQAVAQAAANRVLDLEE
jgi:hypothetical protein